MSGPAWLHNDGPDRLVIDKVDRCEAGECGHAGCGSAPDVVDERAAMSDEEREFVEGWDRA